MDHHHLRNKQQDGRKQAAAHAFPCCPADRYGRRGFGPGVSDRSGRGVRDKWALRIITRSVSSSITCQSPAGRLNAARYPVFCQRGGLFECCTRSSLLPSLTMLPGQFLELPNSLTAICASGHRSVTLFTLDFFKLTIQHSTHPLIINAKRHSHFEVVQNRTRMSATG